MSIDSLVPSVPSLPPLGGAVPPPPPPAPAPAMGPAFSPDQRFSVPAVPSQHASYPGQPVYPAQPAYPAQPMYPQPPYYGSNPAWGTYPPAYGYPPYAGPDVFDGLRDVSADIARGIGHVGREVGDALPVVGRKVGDALPVVGRKVGEALPVVGRTLYDGGKQAVGVLPTVGRGLWSGVTWVGDKLAGVGRWLFGGADRTWDRLRDEYGRPQPGFYPYYPAPWPPAVVVEKGDTLRGIARQFLGDGNRWKEIYALNEPLIKQWGGLRTGMVLRLPAPGSPPVGCPACGPACRCRPGYRPLPAPGPTPVTPAPRPTPAEPTRPVEPPARPTFRSYTVKPDDTLWDLAERFWGDAARWPEIHAANKDKIKDPHWIYPGQVLKIPA